MSYKASDRSPGQELRQRTAYRGPIQNQFVRTHWLAPATVLLLMLGMELAARGQSVAQAEGFGACSTPSEVALADDGLSAAPSFISFEAPGAGTHKGQGTIPYAINSAGVITGNFVDASGVSHGFLRATSGAITTFNARGAGTVAGQGTFARSINSAGAVTGYDLDSSNVYHGFVRAANGTVTSFDVPGAVNTEALGINSAGVITGYYLISPDNVYQGFVRATNGAITAFNPPDACVGAGNGTFPYAINDPCGTITGFYNSASQSCNRSGFVRYPDNTIGSFHAPVTAFGSTQPININSAACATITGDYLDSSNVYHGFVRAANGIITSFDAPGAGTGTNQGTQADSINSAGTVTGDYIDSVSAYHGFVRATNGAITTFDAPGAGTGAGQGTIPSAINSTGVITGYYLDSSNVYHGFVR